MTQIRVNLTPRENAKVDRLRAQWGLKSKQKAIKQAIAEAEEGPK